VESEGTKATLDSMRRIQSVFNASRGYLFHARRPRSSEGLRNIIQLLGKVFPEVASTLSVRDGQVNGRGVGLDYEDRFGSLSSYVVA
jgi:hypothetical protein